MSMDRKSRDWPGGPTAPAPYPYERMGSKNPIHEVGQHVLDVRREILARVDGLTGPANVNVRVWMTCPDARLMSSLAIQFVPDVDGADPLAIANSTIHLVATTDFEFGPHDDEDLIGTRAAPVLLVQAGLRGFKYSPTEEVEAMRADLKLTAPDNQEKGTWWARARWQALHPMSEIEWRDAAARCKLEVSPRGKVLNQVPG